jgi:hypothetical protein
MDPLGVAGSVVGITTAALQSARFLAKIPTIFAYAKYRPSAVFR